MVIAFPTVLNCQVEEIAKFMRAHESAWPVLCIVAHQHAERVLHSCSDPPSHSQRGKEEPDNNQKEEVTILSGRTNVGKCLMSFLPSESIIDPASTIPSRSGAHDAQVEIPGPLDSSIRTSYHQPFANQNRAP